MDLEKILYDREKSFYEQVKYLRKRIKELECKDCDSSQRRKSFLQAELKALENYLGLNGERQDG